MIKTIENIGVFCGIIGALLVAMKLGNYGYPVFLISTVCLFYSAVKFKQTGFIKLQFVYLCCNLLGLVNYF